MLTQGFFEIVRIHPNLTNSTDRRTSSASWLKLALVQTQSAHPSEASSSGPEAFELEAALTPSLLKSWELGSWNSRIHSRAVPAVTGAVRWVMIHRRIISATVSQGAWKPEGLRTWSRQRKNRDEEKGTHPGQGPCWVVSRCESFLSALVATPFVQFWMPGGEFAYTKFPWSSQNRFPERSFPLKLMESK